MEQRKTLLVVEDERSVNEMLVDCFSSRYNVVAAYDGAEALLLAAEHRPDLVILDVLLPLLDGRTVCRKIKAYPPTRHAVVIMLSGKTQQHDRLLGFEVGADDYLEKPTSMPYLERVVERRLAEASAPSRR
jgi:two-component system phosphate regulon response regulator PhoB